jgi:hypothetical protein
MALGSRLYPNGTLQVPTYFDDQTTLTGASVRLTENFYLAKLLDEVTISPLSGGLAKREYSDGTLAVANSFDEISIATYPSSTVPTFNAAVNRPMRGLYSNGRVGWNLSAELPVPTQGGATNWDDGFSLLSQATYSVIAPGLSWYMGNIPYTQLYVGTNGYITFSASYSQYNIVGPQASPSGIWVCPGDQDQGRNGPNDASISTASALAYRKGVTSTGWQFFSINMQCYQHGVPTNDRSWEVNCFFNYDNSVQLVEIVYSPTFSSVNQYTGTAGISTGSTTFNSIHSSNAGFTLNFSSVNRGVTWTYAGTGSWGVGTF